MKRLLLLPLLGLGLVACSAGTNPTATPIAHPIVIYHRYGGHTRSIRVYQPPVVHAPPRYQPPDEPHPVPHPVIVEPHPVVVVR